MKTKSQVDHTVEIVSGLVLGMPGWHFKVRDAGGLVVLDGKSTRKPTVKDLLALARGEKRKQKGVE